jgi:molybdate transport system substrate-binding protein
MAATDGANPMKKMALVAAAVALATLAATVSARADEIKVICSNALRTVLEALAPEFEKATGNTIVFTWGAAIPLKADIEKGAAFDVAVLTTAAIDDLVKQGKLAAATRSELANSTAGVAVRKGAPKPDIGTVQAFTRAVLAAKSVAYVERGATGVYLKTLFERLGIADAIRNKVKLLPPENPAANAVSNGEAEMGITQISEILPYAGAELVGPLPGDIQITTSFATAAGAAARSAGPAAALIKFITAPAAAPAFKAKGLEPAG